MELTTTYVLSQIFIVISYIFLISTYQLKSRKSILVFNFLSLIATGASHFCLSAFSGMAMTCVALIRNIIFLVQEKKGKNDKITKADVIILLVLYAISIVSAVFTYEGILSLMSVFATMLYTYSVWQKNTKVYKYLGIPVSTCWILYDIYITSWFGMLLESCLMVSAIIGIYREHKSRQSI